LFETGLEYYEDVGSLPRTQDANGKITRVHGPDATGHSDVNAWCALSEVRVLACWEFDGGCNCLVSLTDEAVEQGRLLIEQT
jgi:hypothetical protein